MPETPIVVLEIDDNTPREHPPFTNDVSMWSFHEDQNLATGTAAEVFRAMHAATGSSQFRGYPPRASRGTVELFDQFFEANEVTWLSVAEIGADRPWLPQNDNASVVRTLLALFEAIDSAAKRFGSDRVRIVFAFM